MTKVCSKCNQDLDIFLFSKAKTTRDGINCHCKLCINQKSKNHYLKNKKYRSKQIKLYYLQNKEHLYNKQKIYTLKNKKKIQIRLKKYRQKNKEKIKLTQKKWKLKNLKKFRFYQSQYKKQRNKIDIGYRLLNNLRTRIWSALKYNFKSKHTQELLSCNINELKNHIQKQFQPGMTWDNYGNGANKWNLDHIRPCASFDLSQSKEQKDCFHFSNLQPLWAKDNLIKSDKF